MHGPPGISKTSSIVLYSYLCYLINQYEFQFDEVVASDIPRLFYASYSNKDSQRCSLQELENLLELFVKNLLISHFPPKFASMLKECTSVQSLIFEIKKKFQSKNLVTRVAVDQFNTLIAEYRRFNKFMIYSMFTKQEIF